MSRARLASAVIAAAVAATVLTTALPSSAGGKSAKSTDYAAAWTFSEASPGEGVVANLARNMRLTDYQSSEYFDRSGGTPARNEDAVVVQGQSCKISSYYESGLTVYGQESTWANATPGPQSVTGARMRLACTRGGEIHHLRWGVDEAHRNCLVLERTGASTWTLSTGEAAGACPAQDEVVDRNGNTIRLSEDVPIAFTATLTVTGVPPYSS